MNKNFLKMCGGKFNSEYLYINKNEKMIDKVKNFKQFVNEDVEKGKRNTSWSMRQASGEAVQGFSAFLNGESVDDNPYKDAKTMKDGVKYKDWIAGYRNGEDATLDQIEMFNWIHSR